MAIVSFDPKAVIDYVPAYGGNRESADPCIVRLKFVPYSRVQHYTRVLTARIKDVTDGVRAREIGQEVQKQQFCESVESVSGFCIGDREITGPAEFYDAADFDLVTEIVKAMESSAKLNEGQRKN